MFRDNVVTAFVACKLAGRHMAAHGGGSIILNSSTGSLRAREILDQWPERRARFVKVFPHEYRRALGELAASRAAEATIDKARAADPARV